MEKFLYGTLFVIIIMLFAAIIDYAIEQNRIEDDVDPEKKAKSDQILDMYRDVYSNDK